MFKLVLERVFQNLFHIVSWQCFRFDIVLDCSFFEKPGEPLNLLDYIPVVLDIGLQGVFSLLFEILDGCRQFDLLSRKLEPPDNGFQGFGMEFL